MKSLGKVVSIVEDKLVLKTDSLVKIGSKIFDGHGRFVGTVIDHFGPAGGPYLLISPKKRPGKLLGKELFGSGGKK
jgi:rRNA processing protein Gar1